MALPATDSFNRANETPIAGNWTATAGSPRIVSNQWKSLSIGIWNASIWNADTFNDDHYSQAVLGVTNNYPAVAIRGLTTEATFYAVYRNNAVIQYTKLINGSQTNIGSAVSAALSAGDTLKLRVSGQNLIASINGSDQTGQTDASLSSGKGGLASYSSDCVWDDWEGGNVGAASGAIVGHVAGTVAVSGAIKANAELVASSSGTSIVVGQQKATARLAASSLGTSSVIGGLKGLGRLTASTTGTSVVAGTVKALARLTGTSTGITTLVGVLDATYPAGEILGASYGSSTALGSLKAWAELTTGVAGRATVRGRLRALGLPSTPITAYKSSVGTINEFGVRHLGSRNPMRIH